MASTLMYLACFTALLGLSSCSKFENLFQNVYGQKSEKDLRDYLFKTYDPLVRPVKNPRDKITTTLSLTPLFLREMDEKNQVIVLESWVMMNWTDDYLKWDPQQFGNLSVLRIPSTEIWRPDFAVYGAPEHSDLFATPVTNALLYNTGAVLWVPLFTIRSRCPVLKPTKKVLTCNIQIGSWTFDEPSLDVQLAVDKVDLTKFSDNNVNWKLIGIESGRISKHYPCCKEAYPHIGFNVTLSRRWGLSTNTVLAEEDSPINLQDIGLSERDIEKLLKR